MAFPFSENVAFWCKYDTPAWLALFNLVHGNESWKMHGLRLLCLLGLLGSDQGF